MSGQPTDPKRTRRILGALVIVAGVIGAALLWWAAGQRQESAVTGFARAPVGCDTTLDFTSTGTFYLYVERTGNFDDLAGDCQASGEFAIEEADGEPAVRLELLDPDGRDVVLGRERGIDYSAGGFSGTVVRSAMIAETGEYVLRVGSDDGVFAIAVGRQPDDGVATLRSLAVGALLLGVVLGGLLLVLARRAAAAPAPLVTPPWPPQPAAGMQGWGPGPAPSGPPIVGQAGTFPLPAPPPPAPPSGAPLGPPTAPPPVADSTWPRSGATLPEASPSTPAAPPSSWGIPSSGAPASAALWQPPGATHSDQNGGGNSGERNGAPAAGVTSSESSEQVTAPTTVSPWAPPRPD